MPAPITKTKIISTLGPSTATPEMIEKLIHAGVNVFRINFSHGEKEVHGKTIQMVRQVAEKTASDIAILIDLQGPKIRTNKFPGGSIVLKPGTEVTITAGEEDGADGHIVTTFRPMILDSHTGDRILMDDGLIELKVERKESETLYCSVVFGGILKDRKGINLPHTKLKVTALTEKDLEDAKFVLPLDVDYIALSFVRTAADVEELRKVILQSGYEARIVAKIEKPEAITDIDNILLASDAVMVARGDLAVEAGNEKVPSLQKMIIRQSLSHGVPVITATQMLESMITNPTPTRAEASDVANAIFDGTDAVMLSGETAVGKYPIATVEMMKKIIVDAESKEMFFNFDNWSILDSSRMKFGMSLAKAAVELAKEANAVAFAAFSHSGNAAIRITAQRPDKPVYMFSSDKRSIRRMCLVRGCYGIHLGRKPHADAIFTDMERLLVSHNLIKPGDSMVYTSGVPALSTETTNTIHIRIAEELTEKKVCG